MDHSHEAFWHAWIHEIIGETSKEEIERHIVKHAGELHPHMSPEQLADWIASMQNLVAIHAGVVRQHPDTMRRIFRLSEKHLHEPFLTVPPPPKSLICRGKEIGLRLMGLTEKKVRAREHTPDPDWGS